MKILSQISLLLLATAITFTPALGMAQHGPVPETSIPRHTNKGGNGNFVPPPDRKPPADTHHDIPAHPSQSKQAKNTKKGKQSGSSSDAAGAGNP